MKILIADNSGIIPATNYGGIERVIWGLGKELHKLGHEITFLVKSGSSCNFAKVLEFNPDKDLNLQIPNDIDIAHFSHTPPYKINKPVIVTIHTNPPKEEVLNINSVFISKNHAKRYGSSTFVYNGLDWNDYPCPVLDQKRKNFHFLGKASWKIKNVFGATKIALKSGNHIYILGGKRWTFRNLKRNLKYTCNPNVIFKGFVNDKEKIEITQHSKGLIFPVNWHEPFGLAIIESLYAGCAIFGSKNGSLPELINSKIGFTSNSTNEIIKAIHDFKYNPKYCHKYAVDFFNSKTMTLSYLKLYNKILNNETLNTEVPQYITKENIITKFN